VFDFTGHMVLGIITLGAMAQFDSHWDSPTAQALRSAARRLSADLGFQA
jgi:DNA-binding IclR family transcriptional regulator